MRRRTVAALVRLSALLAAAVVAALCSGASGVQANRQYLARVFAGSTTLLDNSFANGLPGLSALTRALYVSSTATTVPYQSVSLPWTYTLFGPVRAVTVSRDGALFLSRGVPSCCVAPATGTATCSFLTTTCGFDTAYANVIAGALTYLQPELSSAATPIGYFMDPQLRFVWFRYQDVPLFIAPALVGTVTPVTLSFSIFLFPSGSIEVRYDTLPDVAAVDGWTPSRFNGTARPLLVGVRGPQNAYPGGAAYATEWNTTRPGVYPPRTAIKSNTTLVFCSLGFDFKISPSVGRVSGGDQLNWATSDDAITGTDGWGCLRQYGGALQLMCRFGNYTLVPDAHDSGSLAPQLLSDTFVGDTRATYDPATGFVSCRVPPLPTGSPIAGTGATSVWLITVDAMAAADPSGLGGGSGGGVARPQMVYGANVTVFNSQQPFVYVPDADPRVAAVTEEWPAPISPATNQTTDRTLFVRFAGYRVARCNEVVPLNARYCVRDCAAVVFGAAAVDDCAVCSGGTTNRTANAAKNRCGVCYGDPVSNATECVDCLLRPWERQCIPDDTTDVRVTMHRIGELGTVTIVLSGFGAVVTLGAFLLYLSRGGVVVVPGAAPIPGAFLPRDDAPPLLAGGGGGGGGAHRGAVPMRGGGAGAAGGAAGGSAAVRSHELAVPPGNRVFVRRDH